MIDFKLFMFKIIGYLLGLLGLIFLFGGQVALGFIIWIFSAFFFFKSNKQRVIIMYK